MANFQFSVMIIFLLTNLFLKDLLLHHISAVTATSNSPCGFWSTNAIYFQGSCYLLSHNAYTWQQAQDACSNSNSLAKTVEPRTQATVRFLLRKFQTTWSVNTIWTGGFNDNGNWVWLSSLEQIDTATLGSHWDGGSNSDQCLNLEANGDKLDNDGCEKTNPYVCQIDVGSVCLRDTMAYHDGVCYESPQETGSYFDAVSSCGRDGGILAHFYTNSIIGFIFEMSILEQWSSTKGDYIYLGAYGSTLETRLWVGRGELVNDGDTNWDSGEPDFNNDSEFCLMLKQSSGLRWHDKTCTNVYNFLCEYDKPISTTVTDDPLSTTITAENIYVVVVPESNMSSKFTHNVTVAISTSETTNSTLTLTTLNELSSPAPIHTMISQATPYTWVVDTSVLISDGGINNRSLVISSPAELQVIVTYVSYSDDFKYLTASLDISPTSFLGLYYVIQTSLVATPDLLYDSSDDFRNLPESLSYIAIVAVENGTTEVFVKFPNRDFVIQSIMNRVKIGNPQTIESTLEQYEILGTKARQDVSGTLVRATQKVAVFCSNLVIEQVRSSALMYTLQQMLPLNHTATEYITVPHRILPGSSKRTSSDALLRIVSLENATSVQIESYTYDESVSPITKSFNIAYPLTTKDVLVPSAQINVIISSKPIAITNLGRFDVLNSSESATVIDTCATPLLPFHLWATEYCIWTAPFVTSKNIWSRLIIVIVCINLESTTAVIDCGLTVNGQSLDTLDSKFYVDYHKFTNYTVVKVTIPITDISEDRLQLTSITPMFGVLRATGSRALTCQVISMNWTNAPTSGVDEVAIFQIDSFSYPSTRYSLLYWGATRSSTVQNATTASPADQTSTEPKDYRCQPVFINLTLEEIEELKENIYENLTVALKGTSSYWRKHNTADGDRRTSSTTIGLVGVAFCCFVIGSMVLFDLSNLFNHLGLTKSKRT